MQRERAATKEGSGSDDGEIRSPMPGVVSEIRVSVGEMVAVGQTVAVIESMKLFIPLAAKAAGEVIAIDHRPGESVTAHQRLIAIGAASAADQAGEREEAHGQ